MREELQAEGHDVSLVRDYGPDPGDKAILELAFAEDRVVVTLDKDFGELVVVHGGKNAGMIRIVDTASSMQGAACLTAFSLAGGDLAKRAIVTIEPRRIRVRPSDDY